MNRTGFTSAAGFAASIVAVASAQTITSVGVLPGDTVSKAWALSANGTTVVGLSRTPATNGTAVRWNAGVLSNLGYIGAGASSEAFGVSPDGLVVAGQSNDAVTGILAFKWTNPGPMIALAPSGSLIQQHAASGVDATGSKFVGTYSVLAGLGVYPRAALWTSSGLTTLSATPGSIASVASKITPDGQYIVGDFGPGTGFIGLDYNPIARVWTNPTTWFTIGTLPGGTWSTGIAISDNGQVVAGTANNGVASQRAYRWTGAGIEDLGTLPTTNPSTGWSRTHAMTPDGWVVVGAGSMDMTLSNRAAMISSGAGLQNLNDYLPSVGVDLTGWNLWETTGVSADGTVLVGNGSYFGQERGWIVRDIPSVCAPKIYENSSAPAVFCAGGFGFLSVTALGPHPTAGLAYQWYKKVGKTTVPIFDGTTGGGSVISGAQSPFMTFNPGFPDVAGNYFCIVYGGCSDAATPIWSVTVITEAPLPGPAPLPLSICQNGSAGWNVTGLNPGAGPFTHQWYFESPANSNNWLPLVDGPTALSFGVPGGIVSGATTSAFTITAAPGNSLKAVHSTRYKCRVSNVCTFTDSPPGVLGICIGDANCDGIVDDGDFVDFAHAYGIFDCEDPNMPPGCPADMNGDGYVDDADFVLFANAYDNFACP
jgi:probable HAF family extracellular repeat protein